MVKINKGGRLRNINDYINCNQVSIKQLANLIFKIIYTRLRDLQCNAHKYAKDKANFDDVAVWKKYRPSHVIEDNQVKFQEFEASKDFKRCS